MLIADSDALSVSTLSPAPSKVTMITTMPKTKNNALNTNAAIARYHDTVSQRLGKRALVAGCPRSLDAPIDLEMVSLSSLFGLDLLVLLELLDWGSVLEL